MSNLKGRRILMVATTAALFAGCLPPPMYSYEEWDVDADTSIDRDELAEWVHHEGVFTAWDRDADSELDANEINENLFGLWDADADDVLSEDEWYGGVDWWYSGDAVYGTYREWDANRDLGLDDAEVADGVEGSGLLERWDLDEDELVQREEFESALFDSWDDDGDGVLDPAEWETGSAWWLD